LTAVELDPAMAQRLHRLYGQRAHIINGDGTQTGLPSEDFSSVVCFTMLHHIPTAQLQDRLFAEAFRLLRHGGVFAGTDGVASWGFKMLHFRDIYNPVPPETLPNRLQSIGFTDVHVDVDGGRQRWRALKP
ncbi:MAG: class I SAM-dependent methyltransferase, partial [Mycobacteriaceae bacterium]|nr:class I SAM-dependent methyltransferase [Mycobacteriaceae bacterium]